LNLAQLMKKLKLMSSSNVKTSVITYWSYDLFYSDETIRFFVRLGFLGQVWTNL